MPRRLQGPHLQVSWPVRPLVSVQKPRMRQGRPRQGDHRTFPDAGRRCLSDLPEPGLPILLHGGVFARASRYGSPRAVRLGKVRVHDVVARGGSRGVDGAGDADSRPGGSAGDQFGVEEEAVEGEILPRGGSEGAAGVGGMEGWETSARKSGEGRWVDG